jgi:hypothetical protein
MNAYRPGSQHISTTIRNYQLVALSLIIAFQSSILYQCVTLSNLCSDALCTSLLSSITISQSCQQEKSPTVDGASSQSSASTASTSTSPLVYVGGSLLAPLFSDLVTLINARKDSMEYYVVIIFTDGQFTDSARYYGVI